jgi:hypothetical protein
MVPGSVPKKNRIGSIVFAAKRGLPPLENSRWRHRLIQRTAAGNSQPAAGAANRDIQ